MVRNRFIAKKRLGQHFLMDQNIAKKIVGSLLLSGGEQIVEVGPGKGILTQYLLEKKGHEIFLIEIDKTLAGYLSNTFLVPQDHLFNSNVLTLDFSVYFSPPVAMIGNFPYNISNPLFFKILQNRNLIGQVVGMIQKEVAERITASHGSKTYGILSVLLQAFYRIEYLFTVNETVFSPRPRVKSAVVRLTRNNCLSLECDERLFFRIVKASFNQRRKMLRNSLMNVVAVPLPDHPVLQKRPEQLSTGEFVQLTQLVETWLKK